MWRSETIQPAKIEIESKEKRAAQGSPFSHEATEMSMSLILGNFSANSFAINILARRQLGSDCVTPIESKY
jgi:hypothetical protein